MTRFIIPITIQAADAASNVMEYDEYRGLDEQEITETRVIAELLYKIREWDHSWGDYFSHGKRPMNISEFLQAINKEFKVTKRVKSND